MTSSVIAILRHADYEQPANVPSAWLPYPLTEVGASQAREAVPAITAFAETGGLTICPVIDSSRMLRAWQTARILATGLGLATIDEFDDLAERSVGAAANLTTIEIEQLLAVDPRYSGAPQGWKSSTDYRLPFQGAESLNEAGLRVAGHVDSCMKGLPSASLKIIVGHGASIRHAAMHLGILARDQVGAVSMFHARPVFLRKTGHKWEKVGGDWKSRTSNEVTDEFGAT